MTRALDLSQRQVVAIFTPATLAEHWQVKPGFVLGLIKSGRLPAFRVGHIWRIKREAVDAFEAENSGHVGESVEPCSVYFIRQGDYVKIGKAGNPKKRFKQLQSANPEPLELLAVIDDRDGHSLETELHRKFAHLRSSGEWFRYGADLVDFIRDEGWLHDL